MQVLSLDQEYPLEKGMATHSSILAWRIPTDRGAWRAIVHGVAQSRTQLQRLSTQAHCFPFFSFSFFFFFFFLPPYPHLLLQTYRIYEKASSPALEKDKEFLLPST